MNQHINGAGRRAAEAHDLSYIDLTADDPTYADGVIGWRTGSQGREAVIMHPDRAVRDRIAEHAELWSRAVAVCETPTYTVVVPASGREGHVGPVVSTHWEIDHLGTPGAPLPQFGAEPEPCPIGDAESVVRWSLGLDYYDPRRAPYAIPGWRRQVTSRGEGAVLGARLLWDLRLRHEGVLPYQRDERVPETPRDVRVWVRRPRTVSADVAAVIGGGVA